MGEKGWGRDGLRLLSSTPRLDFYGCYTLLIKKDDLLTAPEDWAIE